MKMEKKYSKRILMNQYGLYHVQKGLTTKNWRQIY